MTIQLQRGNTSETKYIYLLYDGNGDDRRNTLAILDTRSWDSFKKSAEKVRKFKNWHDKIFDVSSLKAFANSIKDIITFKILKNSLPKRISNYLLENLQSEYFDLLPFFYLWVLEFGYIDAVNIFDTSILPRAASKLKIERLGRVS